MTTTITRSPSVKSSLPGLFFTNEMPRKWPTIFYYAVAGAGKTNALRTLRALNPLILATEDGQTKGMSTLGDLKLAAILIDNLDQLIAVTAELLAHQKPDEIYYQGHGPFGALAVDSLTGVGTMLEDAAKKLKGWNMIWDATAGGGKDPRQAYPYIAEKGRQVVRNLMNLQVPLILTCREQLLSEGDSKTYPAPELPGQKLPKELPGWPEATLRLRVINGKRLFITETEGDVVARIRLAEGRRCPKFIKPDLHALIRLLNGDDSALNDLVPDPPKVQKTPQQLAAEQRRAQAATTAPTLTKP